MPSDLDSMLKAFMHLYITEKPRDFCTKVPRVIWCNQVIIMGKWGLKTGVLRTYMPDASSGSSRNAGAWAPPQGWEASACYQASWIQILSHVQRECLALVRKSEWVHRIDKLPNVTVARISSRLEKDAKQRKTKQKGKGNRSIGIYSRRHGRRWLWKGKGQICLQGGLAQDDCGAVGFHWLHVLPSLRFSAPMS